MGEFIITGYDSETNEPVERDAAGLAQVLEQGGLAMPTAEEIAKAIVIAERESVVGRFQKFIGTDTFALDVPDGKRGNLISISDTGGGLVQFTINGDAPTNNAGIDHGEMSGQYLAAPIRNVDLSALQFNATSSVGDFTVYFEEFV